MNLDSTQVLNGITSLYFSKMKGIYFFQLRKQRIKISSTCVALSLLIINLNIILRR